MHKFQTKSPTVQDVRKAGFKVRVFHGHFDDTYDVYPYIRGLADRFTRIDLKAPTGEEYIGVAYCSRQDNFNRKLGNRIALGRALKKYYANKPE